VPLPERPLNRDDFADLTQLFDAVVAQAGELEAFVDGDRRITFAEWGRAADGVATRLAAMGVGPGDIVGIRLPSSIDYAIAYQAAIRLGAITSGMNPRLGVAETAHILEKSSPAVVVTLTASGMSTTAVTRVPSSTSASEPDITAACSAPVPPANCGPRVRAIGVS